MAQNIVSGDFKEIPDVSQVESYMRQFGEGQISILEDCLNEGIAIIQIKNPSKRNAISGKMMVDLRNCITKLESWKTGKAVILYGFGDNFCSGGDLEFARKCNTAEDGFCLSYLMQDALRRLKNLSLVSVALVHGAAIGGGSEIAVSCDFMVVCKNVKLGFVQGKMGIITAWGGTPRLIQTIGEKRALELLLSSRILNAEECLSLNLASKILDNENKLDQCLEWTRQHVQHHYSVTRAFKEVIALNSRNYDDCLELERRLFAPLWGGPANKHALSKNIKHIDTKKNHNNLNKL